ADREGCVRLLDVPSLQVRATFKGVKGEVYALALSPDGRTLASSHSGRGVDLIDVDTLRVKAHLRPFLRVSSALFTPDSKVVILGNQTGLVYHWDAATGRQLSQQQVDREQKVYALALSPNGRLLATGCSDGRLLLWDTTTRRLVASLRGHARSVEVLR